GGGVTHAAPFSLVVTPAAFNYILSAMPPPLPIFALFPYTTLFRSATLVSGVTTPVTFSITTALPTGVTASAFTPASCSPTCSATLTVTTSEPAPPSTTTFTIQPVSDGVTHTATFSLVVNAAGFDFS